MKTFATCGILLFMCALLARAVQRDAALRASESARMQCVRNFEQMQEWNSKALWLATEALRQRDSVAALSFDSR